MTGEVDWIALESLFFAQEEEDDEAEECYSEQEANNARWLRALARGLCSLARAKREEGDYDAAEPLSRQALEIVEKEFGEDHRAVGEASYCHALSLHQGMRDYASAERLYRRALAIKEEHSGSDHLLVGRVSEHLAHLLLAWGKRRAAEPCLRRAIAIYEKRLGPNHPNHTQIAWPSLQLAILLSKECNYAAAVPLFRRTLAIFENNSRADKCEVAVTLLNLALTLEAMRDYAAAEQSIRRALSIDQTELAKMPDQHLTCLKRTLVRCVDANAELLRAESLKEEAFELARIRDYEAAEPLFRRALAIREKQLGTKHPVVATSLHDLANMLIAKGNYDAAGLVYRRALAIHEKHLGSAHPCVTFLKGAVARISGGG